LANIFQNVFSRLSNQVIYFILAEFPAVHNCSFVKREIINIYSLLYTVTGTTPGKLPYMLASHLDVVPADPEHWQVSPFSGQIVNNTYIYGRGTIDDKGGVLVSRQWKVNFI
jgi:carboxypeptidase PM20D1